MARVKNGAVTKARHKKVLKQAKGYFVMEIQQYGLIHRRFSFQELLSEQADKTEVIAAFLGILELIRMGQLEIEQEELFGEIEISYVADDIKPVKEPVS